MEVLQARIRFRRKVPLGLNYMPAIVFTISVHGSNVLKVETKLVLKSEVEMCSLHSLISLKDDLDTALLSKINTLPSLQNTRHSVFLKKK